MFKCLYFLSLIQNNETKGPQSCAGPPLAESQSAGVCKAAPMLKEALPENCSSKTETSKLSRSESLVAPAAIVLHNTLPEVIKNQTLEDKSLPAIPTLSTAALGVVPYASLPSSTATEGIAKFLFSAKISISPHSLST